MIQLGFVILKNYSVTDEVHLHPGKPEQPTNLSLVRLFILRMVSLLQVGHFFNCSGIRSASNFMGSG